MFQLVPISGNGIDWKSFLSSSKELLGRNPTNGIDEKYHELKHNLPDYISVLKEIFNEGSNPFDDAGSLLNHVSLSFLLIATRQATLSIINHSRLVFSTTESKHDDYYLSLISGDLSQWRVAIVNCCSDEVNYDIRLFGNKILEFMERNGLYQFLSGMKKINMGDGTIRLIEKR